MTYEYVCTSCGYQWEAEQPISAKALRDCPQCSKATAKRQISGGTGFLLKGGGWYADGYGSSSAPKSGEGAAEKLATKGDGATAAAPAASSDKASGDKAAKADSAAAKPADKPKSSAPSSS